MRTRRRLVLEWGVGGFSARNRPSHLLQSVAWRDQILFQCHQFDVVMHMVHLADTDDRPGGPPQWRANPEFRQARTPEGMNCVPSG